MAGGGTSYEKQPARRAMHADALTAPFERFARLEASGGILLVAAAFMALVWVNSPWGASYARLWSETSMTIGVGEFALTKPVVVWINDLLMAMFFLLVGLEIKREILRGELRSFRRASLPIAGAIGGMVVPAGIYAFVNMGEATIRGWGVPMATDIAFALGVMSLLGSRVPLTLRVFLASLAIVDDLGALLVIAIFYSESIKGEYLAMAAGVLALLGILNAVGVRRLVPFLLLGFVLWFFVLKSGIHATIAGVLLAAMVPITSRVDRGSYARFLREATQDLEREGVGDDGTPADLSERQRSIALAIEKATERVESPLRRLEHALLPWISFLIVPVFALANAGVMIRPDDLGEAASSRISIGVALGLMIGKPLGVFAFAWLAVKVGLASKSGDLRWGHIHGAAWLAGIGFTMALFIAGLAFPEAAHLNQAKIAILVASLGAGGIGFAILRAMPAVPRADGVNNHDA